MFWIIPTIAAFMMDTIIGNTTDIDNRLPKGLKKLFNSVLDGYHIQSWRISGEENLIVSIRFCEKPAIGASTPLPNLSVTHERTYRSKPPSAVARDNMRQQAWLGYSNQSARGMEESTPCGDIFTDIGESGFISYAADMTHNAAVTLDKSVTNAERMVNTHNVGLNMGGLITDNYKHTGVDTNMCHNAVQTMNSVTSSSVQTENNTVHQSSVSSQCPSVKKMFCQTLKVSSKTKDLQTDKIQSINQATEMDTQRNMCSTDVMTEYPFSFDKDTMTLPPIGRHTQTDDINYMLKRNGKTFKKASTQLDSVHNDYKDDMKEIQQLKSAMADVIAQYALHIKYRQHIGNIT